MVQKINFTEIKVTWRYQHGLVDSKDEKIDILFTSSNHIFNICRKFQVISPHNDWHILKALMK